MVVEIRKRYFSSNSPLERFNGLLLPAAAVVVPYFHFRTQLFSSPTARSVLLEWLVLISLTGLLMVRHGSVPKWLRLPVALISAAFVIRSVIGVQPSGEFPTYWFGFGPRVALLGVLVASIAAVVLCWRYQLIGNSRHRLDQATRLLLSVLGWIVIAWAVPSLLQPMDAWLNIGDSSEKVLDEVTGWTVGNFPGIHTSWTANTFLGLPLAPLSFLSGFGQAKIILIVLYVNLLVLAIPFCMGWIIRRCVPALGFPASFGIAIVSVTISGSPTNSSLFQELSFLARGLLPVIVAVLTMHLLAKNSRLSHVQVLSLSGAGSIAFWNNFEYGFGALVAVVSVALAISEDVRSAFKQLRRLALGFAMTTVLVVIPGVSVGGNWLGRRLGVFIDMFSGQLRTHSYNNLPAVPGFGLSTLCFVLGVAGVALGFQELRDEESFKASRAGAIGALYFGVWTVMSAPYFLNGGGNGGSRTQFLNIQLTTLTFSIFGILAPKFVKTFQSVKTLRLNRRQSVAGLITALPILLLCSLAASSVLQVPNGIFEWRRVQTPASANQHLDEWSPDRLDWIRPSLIPELVEPFGGVKFVGWWFVYGNAIEALTGVENLLGTTGYETTRTSSQLSLACEPLIRSEKQYVISGSDPSLMSKCAGINVVPRTSPNEDGLVVFEVIRLRNSKTN